MYVNNPTAATTIVDSAASPQRNLIMVHCIGSVRGNVKWARTGEGSRPE
ncbi:MAG: hypothetical protein QOJ11_3974 [Frankiales bacterium]|jgi:hypothetical protein|nr:hypothetical protein [Frankiales bacterium]